MNKCAGSSPPAGWHQSHREASPTADDIERARWLLSNTCHYRHGCINESDDIMAIAKGLAAVRQ